MTFLISDVGARCAYTAAWKTVFPRDDVRVAWYDE